MPIAEAQAEWLADMLRGKATLPSPAEMQAEISGYDRWLEERFVASKRHTIEVDFHPYLREIRRERKRVAQRA
jgi:dimethylaniline monooxygenase (N-oxide forming)